MEIWRNIRFLFAFMADYLSTDDEPTNKIRCPVHGFIHYSVNERSFIDHPVFRRLRSVKQLAYLLCLPGRNAQPF